MTLQSAVEQYTAFRKTLGERFRTNAQVLKAFCRVIGEDAALADVSPETVSAFLAGTGRYAISRGFAAASPLPKVIPKRPPAFLPYVYSHAELVRLLDSTATYQRHRGRLDPFMVRALLLLMYGAALRTWEALSLTIADVGLTRAALTVRDSKFFKSRLVPMGPATVQALADYARKRKACGHPQETTAPFFVGRNGKRVNINTLEGAFQQLREHAGLHREGSSFQPSPP